MIYESVVARSQSFDMLTQDVESLLSSEHVQIELGKIAIPDLATSLADLNNNAFMPNIRHGRLSIPKSQWDTQNVAIWPMGEDELDAETLFEASFARNLFSEMGASRRVPNMVANFASTVLIRVARNDNVRPIVFVGPEVMESTGMFPSLGRQLLMAHEYVHAYDLPRERQLLADDPLLLRTIHEFRAYHVEHWAEKAYMSGMVAVYNCDPGVEAVETVRQAHTNPENPFVPINRDAAIQDLAKVGVPIH